MCNNKIALQSQLLWPDDNNIAKKSHRVKLHEQSDNRAGYKQIPGFFFFF